MSIINPISPDEFSNKLKTKGTASIVNYEEQFRPYIEQAVSFSIGPFFWFIPDQVSMKIVAASDNIAQFTIHEKIDWLSKGPDFFASQLHPDDSLYVLSAVSIAIETAEQLPRERQSHVRINIYGRMLNAVKVYRWVLIQFPTFYFNEQNKVESGLVLITDLSHLNWINAPMMTIIDNANSENQYFSVAISTRQLKPHLLPNITKREQEILQLIVRGLNTPQMVEQLNISYHTVENHKRNLRTKTNTKTTAELVHFVMANNLL